MSELTRGRESTGDIPDLEELILQAEAGSEIRLVAGDYTLLRPLVVSKPITLIGLGMDQTRIVCRASGLVARFDTAGPFHVRNLTFAHEGDEPAHVVIVAAGPFDFRNCRFTGAVRGEGSINNPIVLNLGGDITGNVISCEVEGGSYGVIASGGCQVTLQANHCSGAATGGITITGGSGVVRRNRCERCGYGIAVVNSAPVLEENVCRENNVGIVYTETGGGTASNNECVENSACGVYMNGTAAPQLAANTFSRNGGSGVEIAGEAAPLLLQNAAESNGAHGIHYAGGARGAARLNGCRANAGSGIALFGTAAPDLEENVCERNALPGIAYFENAGGAARRNNCRGNERSGIVVTNSAAPVLDTNDCRENQTHGIYFKGEAAGSCAGNVCESNDGEGIVLAEASRPSLENNVCQNNKGGGIWCKDNARTVARRNACAKNQENGFRAEGDAAVELELNACNENEENGILIFNNATATLRENACNSNRWSGISIRSSARVLIENNECAEDGDSGITIWAGSAAEIKKNRCRDNASAGIAIAGDATPHLAVNRCHGNLQGIRFQDSSAGTARANQCEENKETGILLVGQAHPVVDFNICQGNGKLGINVAGESAPMLDGNICERNDVGMAWIGSTAGTARKNRASENFSAGAVFGDNARPVIENNFFIKNVGPGTIVYPPAKPRLKDNDTSGNHVPDPRIFTIPGSAKGDQTSEKIYVTEISDKVAPTTLLERVAHHLTTLWKVHSQLDPLPSVEDGWQFMATLPYSDRAFSGTVVLNAVAYVAHSTTRLQLSFSEDRIPMWMAQQAQQIVAAALFGLALDLHELTGATMPWTCLHGNWGHSVTYNSPTGQVYQVARFG